MTRTNPYVTPSGCRIGADEKKLYRLEEQRDRAFEAAAVELQRVLSELHGRELHFWHEALPEAIFTFLDGWDHQAGQRACVAWLRRHGFNVTEPEPED